MSHHLEMLSRGASSTSCSKDSEKVHTMDETKIKERYKRFIIDGIIFIASYYGIDGIRIFLRVFDVKEE